MRWLDSTVEERADLLKICSEQGHDFYYIEGTHYEWDCARCNWQDFRFKPTLPLVPSRPVHRWRLVDQWAARS